VRVHRTFAFVDLSGFTRFTDLHGDDEAVAVLSQFRSAVRSIASDIGVRVAKWLGDGAMLVSVEGPALVRAVMELDEVFSADGLLPVRSGVAAGPVILFEGDDYTGGAVNLASRLCDLAQPFEVLTTAEVAEDLPEGVAASPVGERAIPGLGAPVAIVRLTCLHDDDPAVDALASDL
jgi:class 3 adenylate cyclase